MLYLGITIPSTTYLFLMSIQESNENKQNNER